MNWVQDHLLLYHAVKVNSLIHFMQSQFLEQVISVLMDQQLVLKIIPEFDRIGSMMKRFKCENTHLCSSLHKLLTAR